MTLTYEIRNKAVPNVILVISIHSELKFDCVAIPKTWTFISAFHPISMKLSLNWFCEIRAGMFNFSVSWVQTQNLYLVSWPSPSLDYLQCVLESQLRYNFLSWDQTLTLICWKLFSNLRNQSRAMIIETLSPVFICLVWNWRLTDSLIFFHYHVAPRPGTLLKNCYHSIFQTFLWSLSSQSVWIGCENGIITHQKRALTMDFCSQFYSQSKISRKPFDNF